MYAVAGQVGSPAIPESAGTVSASTVSASTVSAYLCPVLGS
jgi:hypothetical protein